MQKEEMWPIATEDSKWSEIDLCFCISENKKPYFLCWSSKILQLKATQ